MRALILVAGAALAVSACGDRSDTIAVPDRDNEVVTEPDFSNTTDKPVVGDPDCRDLPKGVSCP